METVIYLYNGIIALSAIGPYGALSNLPNVNDKFVADPKKGCQSLSACILCRSLLKAGLVDRFRVVVFPVITGSIGYD